MKRFISVVMIALMVLSFFSILVSAPKTSLATDPSYPDQGCVNGVNNTGLYTWADKSPTVVFTPRFNWLNAVSVRIKGTNPTGTPRVRAEIWDWHSNPHRMLASHTVELENRTSEYWQQITESSQDMDPGLQYALVLTPRDGTQVYWSATTNTSCYSRGYAMHDGAQDLSLMYGFSTYGWYDSSNPNSDGTMPGSGTSTTGSTSGTSNGSSTGSPAADSSGDNPTGVSSSSGSESTSSGNASSNTGNSGGTSATADKSSSTPTTAEILSLFGKDAGDDSMLGRIFGSPAMMIIWPLLSFLFWAIIIALIIILIVRHNRKKKAAAPSVAASSAQTNESPKPAPKIIEEEKQKK